MVENYIITPLFEDNQNEVVKICNKNAELFSEKLKEAHRENPNEPPVAKKCMEAVREILASKKQEVKVEEVSQEDDNDALDWL